MSHFSVRKEQAMKTKIAVLILAGVALAAAQRTNGYVVFTAGQASSQKVDPSRFGVGFGTDMALYKGIGVNAEMSCQSKRACGSGSILALASLGPSYHFVRDRERKIDPFVEGGYSLNLSSTAVIWRLGAGANVSGDAAGLWYLGAGANAWFSRRLGVRMEFRDNVESRGLGTAHYWGFRAGIAIR
jgi:hypothetical protein